MVAPSWVTAATGAEVDEPLSMEPQIGAGGDRRGTEAEADDPAGRGVLVGGPVLEAGRAHVLIDRDEHAAGDRERDAGADHEGGHEARPPGLVGHPGGLVGRAGGARGGGGVHDVRARRGIGGERVHEIVRGGPDLVVGAVRADPPLGDRVVALLHPVADDRDVARAIGLGRHLDARVDHGLRLRALLDHDARAVQVLDHEAVDQRVDRVGLERRRVHRVAALLEPALELRGELRLERGLAGHDDTDVRAGRGGCQEEDGGDQQVGAFHLSVRRSMWRVFLAVMWMVVDSWKPFSLTSFSL